MDLSSFFLLFINFFDNFISIVNTYKITVFGLQIGMIDVIIAVIMLGMFYSIFFKGAKG